MFENKTSDQGTVTLADNVVSTIAGAAASGIPGVAELKGSLKQAVSELLLGRKSLLRGIQVEPVGGEVAVDLQIITEYGVSIPEISRGLQENVKKDIETMTGLKVRSVNVHILGVRINSGSAVSA
ncbi:MAG: Asp23/Gls24 family envelope stress response protein [Christensenellales bacterium]